MGYYFLYSGCSLEAAGSGSHYMISLEGVAKVLGINLKEIEDWNCCGASISYVGGTELQSIVLNARNLALAEAQGAHDIVAPCSSCYIMLNKVNHHLKEDPKLLATVNSILAEGGLKYSGKLKARHLLDVLYHDVGVEKIKSMVSRPLTGVKVAAYYGCQTTRPFGEYDSKENPRSQDEILRALGATVVDHGHRVKCCGSGIFLTEIEHCAQLAKNIIDDAAGHGATMISTSCPMCLMNLEIYQPRINKMLGCNLNMPILFVTQLMAVAFNLSASTSALNRLVIPAQGL
ncbi:CoB--CoM heterodisulfide reductase [Desulfarculales bacterium]